MMDTNYFVGLKHIQIIIYHERLYPTHHDNNINISAFQKAEFHYNVVDGSLRKVSFHYTAF